MDWMVGKWVTHFFLPLSRLMDGNSGADKAPSLSSWSMRPDVTVLRPVLRPGCCGNVLPLRGNEFVLKPKITPKPIPTV